MCGIFSLFSLAFSFVKSKQSHVATADGNPECITSWASSLFLTMSAEIEGACVSVVFLYIVASDYLKPSNNLSAVFNC